MKALRSLAAIALFSLARQLSATPIAAELGGLAELGGGGYIGQSFRSGVTGTFSQVSFNFFYGVTSTVPYALGDGFLFATKYTGTPNQLSANTPGLLGEAAAANGFYTFTGPISFTAGSQYYLYTDVSYPGGDTLYGEPPHDLGGLFLSFDPNEPFGYRFMGIPNGIPSLNFVVTGQAATPEPSSFALLGTGLLGVAGLLKRRFVS